MCSHSISLTRREEELRSYILRIAGQTTDCLRANVFTCGVCYTIKEHGNQRNSPWYPVCRSCSLIKYSTRKPNVSQRFFNKLICSLSAFTLKTSYHYYINNLERKTKDLSYFKMNPAKCQENHILEFQGFFWFCFLKEHLY